jgi:hypothetical protein
MAMLVSFFWVVHLSATVAILAGWLASRLKATWGVTMMAWAARSQIVIGLILVNLDFARGLDYGKVVLKLALAVMVVAFAEIANAKAKHGGAAPKLEHAAVGLTVLNATLSFLL